jgi:hypothetical protein
VSCSLLLGSADQPGDFFPLYPYIAYGDNISIGNFSRPEGFRLEAGLKGASYLRGRDDGIQ